MARTPHSPFEISDTSTTSYDFTNSAQAFDAAPTAKGTDVDVATTDVVVATVVSLLPDPRLQAESAKPAAKIRGKERRVIARNKVSEFESYIRDVNRT
jgi:hypothetical protein